MKKMQTWKYDFTDLSENSEYLDEFDENNKQKYHLLQLDYSVELVF